MSRSLVPHAEEAARARRQGGGQVQNCSHRRIGREGRPSPAPQVAAVFQPVVEARLARNACYELPALSLDPGELGRGGGPCKTPIWLTTAPMALETTTEYAPKWVARTLAKARTLLVA